MQDRATTEQLSCWSQLQDIHSEKFSPVPENLEQISMKNPSFHFLTTYSDWTLTSLKVYRKTVCSGRWKKGDTKINQECRGLLRLGLLAKDIVVHRNLTSSRICTVLSTKSLIVYVLAALFLAMLH